jgi:hypothetical protein
MLSCGAVDRIVGGRFVISDENTTAGEVPWFVLLSKYYSGDQIRDD